jgi:hypothetical protein
VPRAYAHHQPASAAAAATTARWCEHTPEKTTHRLSPYIFSFWHEWAPHLVLLWPVAAGGIPFALESAPAAAAPAVVFVFLVADFVEVELEIFFARSFAFVLILCLGLRFLATRGGTRVAQIAVQKVILVVLESIQTIIRMNFH